MKAKVQIFLFKNWIRIVTYDDDIDEPLLISTMPMVKQTKKLMLDYLKVTAESFEFIELKEFKKLGSECIGLMSDLDLLLYDETQVYLI